MVQRDKLYVITHNLKNQLLEVRVGTALFFYCPSPLTLYGYVTLRTTINQLSGLSS